MDQRAIAKEYICPQMAADSRRCRFTQMMTRVAWVSKSIPLLPIHLRPIGVICGQRLRSQHSTLNPQPSKLPKPPKATKWNKMNVRLVAGVSRFSRGIQIESRWGPNLKDLYCRQRACFPVYALLATPCGATTCGDDSEKRPNKTIKNLERQGYLSFKVGKRTDKKDVRKDHRMQRACHSL
jgi:hypothetical protein